MFILGAAGVDSDESGSGGGGAQCGEGIGFVAGEGGGITIEFSDAESVIR